MNVKYYSKDYKISDKFKEIIEKKLSRFTPNNWNIILFCIFHIYYVERSITNPARSPTRR